MEGVVVFDCDSISRRRFWGLGMIIFHLHFGALVEAILVCTFGLVNSGLGGKGDGLFCAKFNCRGEYKNSEGANRSGVCVTNSSSLSEDSFLDSLSRL